MTERVMRYEALTVSPRARRGDDGDTNQRDGRSEDDDAPSESSKAYDAMCARLKDRWKGDATKDARTDPAPAERPSDDDGKDAGQGRRDLSPHERRMTDRWKTK